MNTHAVASLAELVAVVMGTVLLRSLIRGQERATFYYLHTGAMGDLRVAAFRMAIRDCRGKKRTRVDAIFKQRKRLLVPHLNQAHT